MNMTSLGRALVCISVNEDPTALAKGPDPQLDRAIAEVMDRVAKTPPAPARPPHEMRVPRTAGSGGL
jgi:hypothetical protein